MIRAPEDLFSFGCASLFESYGARLTGIRIFLKAEVFVPDLSGADFLAAGETAASGAQVRRKIMREGIHPKYYQATVTCNCGNTFVTGSTSPEIHVEVCSKCHSFYTGTQKTAAAKGRIDKFNRKYGLGNK